MYSLAEFDTYAKEYLLSWDKKSTIRTQKRSRLDANSIELLEFTFPMDRFLHYAEIQALTKKDLQPFYVRWLCDMLFNVARNEVEVIADLCSRLANQNIGIELSNAIRQVAITVAADEYYHAYAAREMLADFEDLTGHVPAGQKAINVAVNTLGADANNKNLSQRESPLEYFKNALPPGMDNIGLTVLLCILENAVVDDFVVMAANQQATNPFSIYMREHLRDEGRHKVFFQKLLNYIWDTISEEQRIILGQAIVGYAIQYFPKNSLDKQIQSNAKFLSKFNLADSVVQSIAHDSAMTESSKPFYENKQINGLMSLMDVSGVTRHKPTHQFFLENDLIAA